jgi:hypothetical protein
VRLGYPNTAKSEEGLAWPRFRPLGVLLVGYQSLALNRLGMKQHHTLLNGCWLLALPTHPA